MLGGGEDGRGIANPTFDMVRLSLSFCLFPFLSLILSLCLTYSFSHSLSLSLSLSDFILIPLFFLPLLHRYHNTGLIEKHALSYWMHL